MQIIIIEYPLTISFWIFLALRMFITWFKAKTRFTIREETFCSVITTIDLLIMEPSQRKGEHTFHNLKFINYQSNSLCFNFDIPWWGTSKTPWSSWILYCSRQEGKFCFWLFVFDAVMALGFEILLGRTLLWTMRMIVMKNGKRYSSLNLFGNSICSIFISFSYRKNCT